MLDHSAWCRACFLCLIINEGELSPLNPLLYRWVLANELIQARDNIRLLAYLDRVDELAVQRLRDVNRAWSRLQGDPVEGEEPAEADPEVVSWS